MTLTTSSPVSLYSLLGSHAGTAALKSGRVSSPMVTFDFADVKVINTQFKSVVRELKYDFAELAIATYLQGHEYGKPYMLLPATIMGRGQHHTIFYNAGRGPLTPADLNGKRLGVRAYTVTTGMWVRGILAGDYGVDLQSITWVTFEEPHVAEFRDPRNVERAPAGKELKQMLLDGEIDAAILGDVADLVFRCVSDKEEILRLNGRPFICSTRGDREQEKSEDGHGAFHAPILQQ